MSESTSLAAGDVVQIDPAHDKTFGGCFMVVTEVKGWGAQGYVQVPGGAADASRNVGLAYYRCPTAAMKRIGRGHWVVLPDA